MNQDNVIKWIGYFAMAIPIVGGIAAVLWVMWRKDKAEGDRVIFLQGVHIAYGIVNNIAAMTPNKIDDKAAEFLKQLETYLTRKGVEASPALLQEGQMIADAIHGNEKARSDAPVASPPP